jgi:Zn-dependent peptidase ImmA (M78 family)
VFFFPVPPEEIPPEREFRTLPDADLVTLAADTHMQIRLAHAYQLALREVFDDRNPSEHPIWRSVRLSREAPIEPQAQAIRDCLHISLDIQCAWKDDDSALKQWRTSIEDAGIFVFKASFKQKEISGLCLSDKEFPVIYLNNSTTKTRQICSLLHELAHLLLSINGLSKLDQRYLDRLPAKERNIEKYCNNLAAEVLIPSADFAAQTRSLPDDFERLDEKVIASLATRYRVSREAILRRFLDQGRITPDLYEQQAKKWASQNKSTGTGGDWYATKNTYLSARFTKEVMSRHYRNQLSVEQAAELLGIKPKQFSGIEQQVLRGSVA